MELVFCKGLRGGTAIVCEHRKGISVVVCQGTEIHCVAVDIVVMAWNTRNTNHYQASTYRLVTAIDNTAIKSSSKSVCPAI